MTEETLKPSIAQQETSCPACGCKETEIHFDGDVLYLHCLGCLSDTAGGPLLDANALMGKARREKSGTNSAEAALVNARLVTTGIYGRLRDLLSRYTTPCPDPCQHANCPVLRDVGRIMEEFRGAVINADTRPASGTSELVCDSCKNAARDPEAAEGRACARYGCGGTLRVNPLSVANSAPTYPEGFTPEDARVLHEANGKFAQENHDLRVALRFYANGDHLMFDKPDLWEDVSGEPPNILQRENEGFCEMVEDGSIAKMALLGKEIDWDDEEPKVIEGEPEDLIAREVLVAGDGKA